MEVKGTVSMGLVGCKKSFTVEVDDEAVEGLTGWERDQVIEEVLIETMWEQNIVELEWEEVSVK